MRFPLFFSRFSFNSIEITKPYFFWRGRKCKWMFNGLCMYMGWEDRVCMCMCWRRVYVYDNLYNYFTYNTTIPWIRCGRIFTLETIIVTQRHVLLWRYNFILFHMLHIVWIWQTAYVVIWWICKIQEKRNKKLIKYFPQKYIKIRIFYKINYL